jgi:RNA polymerase sigma-70 factor (ECF subfamily)
MPDAGPDQARERVNETELVAAARVGDPRGLAGLYHRHGAALFDTAYRLTGSPADAEDIVHDVFVGLPEALRHYREQGSFGAWLRRVAVRVVLMRLRSQRRRGEVSLEAADTSPAPERADANILGADLWRSVAALPDSLRTVFVLKQVEGYSHQEIATVMGISAGASRVRLARALESLRRSLTPD